MTGRRRILHVITRLEPGGAQRNTLYTVAHLDRREFSPVLAWGPGDPLDDEARRLDGVELCPVPDLARPVRPWRDLRALAGLRRLIRRVQPDVVHTHSSKAGILGRLAARLERAPAVVHSIHGYGFTPLQPPATRAAFLAAERLAARWTDRFVAVARSDLERGVALGLFPRERVVLIRSGIELGRFRAADPGPVRRRLRLPDGASVVAQVGNFKPQKAPFDFVRAAAAVAGAHPGTVFVMTGDGPLRPAAERLAAELVVADRFCFSGWLDDIAGLLAVTDVSVLTSRHEGLPRAVVESIAAGVPIVATAVDGTVEVVRDGVTGLLVPPGDIAGLTEAISALLADPGRRAEMARAAGAEDLAEFDIDRMVRDQEELYRCLTHS